MPDRDPFHQPYVWGIIRVPYRGMAWDDRSDDVDDVILDALNALAVRLEPLCPGAQVHCLDHEGVSEWIAEVLRDGLCLTPEHADA